MMLAIDMPCYDAHAVRYVEALIRQAAADTPARCYIDTTWRLAIDITTLHYDIIL